MGNIDSRSQFHGGYFIIQTEKPFYHPGEIIQAKVYMRITKPLAATHIDVEVKGKEKGSFRVYKSRRIPENGMERTEWYWDKHKSRREIMESKMTVFTFPTGNLVPGDYAFPISFPMPRGIPASMFFK